MKRLALLGILLLFGGGAAAQQNEPVTATAYGTVNVRSGPSAQNDIVGQLEAGERVSVTGRDSETAGWLRVTLPNNRVGWVASFAVSVQGEMESLPVINSDSGSRSSGGTATVIAYGQVNVRGGPGMNYPIVGQLDVEDTAVVNGRNNEENDWLYIENEDLQGWVAYFTVTIRGSLDDLPLLVVDGSGENAVSPEDVVTARYNVRLRAEPGLNSTILEIVPFRSNVTPLARTDDGDWVYVVYREVYGWGAARLFDLTQEQVDELPIYGVDFELIPQAEQTPHPDAEG